MKKSTDFPPIETRVVYPWGNRQEKPIGQLDSNTFLSDRALYSKDEIYDMQGYGHAKIIHTAPQWLFAVSLLVAIMCVWAGVSAFNAWVAFNDSAFWLGTLRLYTREGFEYGRQMWRFFYMSSTAIWLIFFVSLAASIAGFFVYNKQKRTWLDVFFNEDKIRFNVTWMDPLEVSKFQRSLRIVKNGRYSDL